MTSSWKITAFSLIQLQRQMSFLYISPTQYRWSSFRSLELFLPNWTNSWLSVKMSVYFCSLSVPSPITTVSQHFLGQDSDWGYAAGILEEGQIFSTVHYGTLQSIVQVHYRYGGGADFQYSILRNTAQHSTSTEKKWRRDWYTVQYIAVEKSTNATQSWRRGGLISQYITVQ